MRLVAADQSALSGVVNFYRFGDIDLASSIALPELPAATNGGAARISVRLTRQRVIRENWHHQLYEPNGEVVLSYGKDATRHYLRFPGLADYSISAAGDQVCCRPESGVPDETVRHLLLDQVLPRALSQRPNCLALHASGVLTAGGVVALLGESGSGKSTLAAKLRQHGGTLLSDDCLLLAVRRRLTVVSPSYMGLRLFPDSLAELQLDDAAPSPMAHYSNKRRLSFAPGTAPLGTGPWPLRKLILLDPAATTGAVSLSAVSPRDAAIMLLKNSFRLDLGDRLRHVQVLRMLAAIIGDALCLRLCFSHSYGLLDEVVAAAIGEDIDQRA